MKAYLMRTLTLGTVFTLALAAQSQAPTRPDESVPQNVPYHGQTGLPNNAAANDQPNRALSGNTPETNSTLQKTRSGNLGIELGWLGVFGLAGLFGLSRGSNRRSDDTQHVRTPEMHRG